MEKAKVFFTDFRTLPGVSQGVKLQKLCRAADIGSIDLKDKFVAIKMHFGELGNYSFLRPNYVKAVADLIRELGGRPFLTDCNTLYPGSRKNAIDHLTNAELNGFNSVTTGCHVIIADGLRGTDDIEIPVPNGEYCQTALVGHAPSMPSAMSTAAPPSCCAARWPSTPPPSAAAGRASTSA